MISADDKVHVKVYFRSLPVVAGAEEVAKIVQAKPPRATENLCKAFTMMVSDTQYRLIDTAHTY